jgi:hypothetical protein
MLQSFDKGKQVDIRILDFSKAFDTVSHDRLLHKIDQYGIRGPLHTWLTSFPTERKMRVALEGEYSDDATIDSGVPHGTVLGPILFFFFLFFSISQILFSKYLVTFLLQSPSSSEVSL